MKGIATVRWSATLLACCVIGSAARGQSPGPRPGQWSVASDLGLNAARGNSSYTMLSTGVRFTHLDRNQFELDWASALTYGEGNGDVIARRMLTTLKGDFHPHATWSPFVFGSIERDRIRRIDALSNAGAGAKWTFFRDTAGTASVSLAGLYSYKAVLPATPTAPADPIQRVARLSLRPKIVQKYRNGFTFEQTSFWQPVVTNTADYNIDSNTRIGFSPNKVSTLFLQYTYRVDSRPPSGVKREDQLMVAGVRLQY